MSSIYHYYKDRSSNEIFDILMLAKLPLFFQTIFLISKEKVKIYMNRKPSNN